MPLEVKTTFHMEALKKSLKQIKGTMDLFNEWVGGDLTEDCGWKFVPAICFENQIINIDEEFCGDCVKFILHGDLMELQVDKMLGGIPQTSTNNKEKAREEFINIAKYLALNLN